MRREAAAQSTTAGHTAGRDRIVPPPANDDRKSAIVTGRKPRSWRPEVPDTAPEEHKRRGDGADAMFREMKRKIAGPSKPKVRNEDLLYRRQTDRANP